MDIIAAKNTAIAMYIILKNIDFTVLTRDESFFPNSFVKSPKNIAINGINTPNPKENIIAKKIKILSNLVAK